MSARLDASLAAVIAGDVDRLPVLIRADSAALAASAARLAGTLTVTKATAVSVLRRFAANAIDPEDAQAWASFVRWGLIPREAGSPTVEPIQIDFDPLCEEAIVELVGRLDEIGDVVDGVISRREMLQLLRNFDC